MTLTVKPVTPSVERVIESVREIACGRGPIGMAPALRYRAA